MGAPDVPYSKEHDTARALLEMLSVYVILLNADYHVIFANRFFRERFGEAHGKRCFEYLFNLTEPCENCETYKVMQTRANHHWEWTGPDNRNYDIHDYPFYDSDGTLLIMEMGIDITERKQAEAEVAKHRDHFEELVKERTQDLQAARQEALRLMEEAQQAKIQVEWTNAELERLTNQLQAQNEELSVHHEELEQQNEELQRNEAALRENEARLQEYATRLELLNGELQDFATHASHDLQEPLRKIKAFGDRLMRNTGSRLAEDELDYIQRMQNASTRMELMIESLLAYSRVTTRARPICRVDLAEIAEDVLSDLEVRIEQNQAEVVVENLPVIAADPVQMHELLQNLIGNAVKFARPGVKPVVRVRAESEQTGICKSVTLFVEDNGIGFDQEKVEQLFQPFHRPVHRNEYDGTGFGLAICRKIVERHKGTITARSQPGQGATFIITLPMKA